MKETLNVNIGGQVFTLERDAYNRLYKYLNDVRRYITTDTEEVVRDIEIRIAEILCESLPSSMTVVTLLMVDGATSRVGRPEDFASQMDGASQMGGASRNYAPRGQRRLLRRPRMDRWLAGVCSGLADYLGIDVTLVRVLTICLVIFGGMSLWVYIILWLLIPESEV